MQHLYLFTLEITPLEVGRVYSELPSHLTLMSRFFSELSAQNLALAVEPLFLSTAPVRLTFDSTTRLGPKQVTAHMVTSADEKALHRALHASLDKVNVTYQYPQFIGDGHKPHVTAREGIEYKAGDERIANAAYLIEVIDGERVIRSKFRIGA